MREMLRMFSGVLSGICAVNVFVHVYLLKRPKKPKTEWALWTLGAAFAAACSYLGMREMLSGAWMAFFHLSAVLIGVDILGGIIRLFGRERRAYRWVLLFKRRGGAFLLALLYIAFGMINMRVVRRTDYAVRHENVREEMTVALISDSHLSDSMNAEKLIKIMKKALSEGADMIVLAGDITDESTEKEEFLRFTDLLSAVRAPKGIYFVFGNHDASRYGGDLSAHEMEEAFKKAGVTVLTDETVLLDGWLRIAGRNDANLKRMPVLSLLENCDLENEFVILIDHQPAQTLKCAEAGANLMLSGHTHNGQLFPVNVISRLFRMNDVEYGLEEIGEMKCVVSSGVSGWSCAFRTAGRSEYVMIELDGK